MKFKGAPLHDLWEWASANPRLFFAFTLSVALHLVVLVRFVTPEGSSFSRDQAVPVHVVIVRTEAEVLPSPAQALAEPSPKPDTAAETAPPPPSPTAQPQAAEQPRPPTPSPDATQPASVVQAPPAVQQPPVPSPNPSATGESAGASAGAPPQSQTTVYHPAGSLNPPPRLLTDVNTENVTVREDGRVVIKVMIDERGTVESVIVLRSYPAGRYDAAAIAAFSAARYSPGYLGGRAVKSQVSYEIDYLPTNRGSAVSGQSN